MVLNVKINSNDTLKISNFEKILFKTDLIYDYYVTSISNKKMNYKIIFNGSPDMFLKIMKEKDIIIDIENEVWKIK